MRIGFKFGTIPLLATIALVALGIALGQWQDRRAAQKIALQTQLAQRSAQPPLPLTAGATPDEFRRVSIRGQFVPGFAIFLDNRPYQGRAGFYLLMPFKIEDADRYVLVARGWLARQAEFGKLPAFATPTGTVQVDGVVRASMGHVMQLGSAAPLAPNAIVQNVAIDDVAKASGLPLAPFFVEQLGPTAAGDTLVRDWPAPALGVEKHQGYAFQWYALAAMAFLFFVFTGFRRGSKPD